MDEFALSRKLIYAVGIHFDVHTFNKFCWVRIAKTGEKKCRTNWYI
jgi:hypothetical protein